MNLWKLRPPLAATAVLLGLAACADPSGIAGFDVQDCDLFSDKIFDGGPGRDDIPALVHPEIVPASQAVDLEPTDRVLGVVRNGAARAYPFEVMWWHEVVNDTVGGEAVLVTYCPLTGSGLAFDPVIDGKVVEFGVSGLIFENNLVMFDRGTESLWPQLLTSARCGARSGTQLSLAPIVETTWERWQQLYPQTTVLTNNTGFSRRYGEYPYGSYDLPANQEFFFPGSPINITRPPKELTLGVLEGNAAVGYPFQGLFDLGNRAAVSDVINSRPIVVLWDGDSQTAIAYDRTVGGQVLQLTVVDNPDAVEFRDAETGSIWTQAGLAVSGDLEGSQLTPLDEAYVVFWFSWSVFHRFARLGVE